MEIGDYNKVEIMHTNTLNKELRECYEEFIKIKDKIRSLFEDYQSKISSNKNVPAQDPCVECLVKPTCVFKKSIESDEIKTGAFVSEWDGKVFAKEMMFEGEICDFKLRAELLNAIKNEVQSEGFVKFYADQKIEKLTDTPQEFNPYPFYWPEED
jgi:hypothetical protein